jgi:hypothetical protein
MWGTATSKAAGKSTEGCGQPLATGGKAWSKAGGKSTEGGGPTFGNWGKAGCNSTEGGDEPP